VTTPYTTLVFLVLVAIAILTYEVVALGTGGWTISEAWWLWAAQRQWLNPVLLVALVALFLHAIFPNWKL